MGNFSSALPTDRVARTGKVRSFEALLRWYHPDRGMVCPDDFIALAEETKLILPMGLWVIRTAADQLRKWQTQFEMNPPLSISVNLSCRQFLQPDLVYQVERALLETGLDPRCLNMEITESAIMEQVESATSALSKLKSLGIKLAMDDFGKGYSSLSYLHQFPFDTLKIDRSFIAGIGHAGENTEIVRTIISLGKGSGAGCGRRRCGDRRASCSSSRTWDATSARVISSRGR